MTRRFCLLVLTLALAAVATAQTPAALERELLTALKQVSKSGTYGGNYDEEKNDAANKQIRDKLNAAGSQLAVLKYAFPRLKDLMYVATSRDGRLRIYSWDLETGGTMHDFDNVYQYQGASGKVYAWSPKEDDEAAGSFYHQIFQVNAKAGPIYLANGNFIGSSSLSGQSIVAMRIDGEKLDTGAKVIKTGKGLQNSVSFTYDFFSVVDRPERPIKLFNFDEARQSFSFPIVIEDDKTPQGRVTNKFITYVFDGTYFVKSK